ncbi:MAG: CPBP family intramembrane metalloprotease [Ignavibacteriales bacterium]|nr:CPBP family intramembrane metalloprotease [Ignavibacteriales bacterium]MCF8305812.1 CPBP family intramembrane metalloprotease [Ignavibacteriales bacterium]MCF8315534.1 CPBP family intramembrane metalloprotease [Ignavibacteriales bacterium]MCF8436936.1 CPBP family intramembrane metalloprotease [Ignavibacteriales bacterium]
MQNDNFNPNDDQLKRYRVVSPQNPLISPFAAAFLGVFGVMLLYFIGGGLLTIAITGLDFEKADKNALRLLQIASQILFLLAPALILAKVIYQDVGFILKFRLPAVREILFFIVALALLMPLFQYYVELQSYLIHNLAENSSTIKSLKEALDLLDKSLSGSYEIFLKSNSIFELSFVAVVIAVTPALCEEVLFRGFIQSSFQFRLSPFKSALITGLLFALIHFNPYGLLPLIFLGVFLGYSYYRSGTIIIPMILHFTNNFVSLIFYYFLDDNSLIETQMSPPTEDLSIIISLFVGFSLAFGLIILFINNQYSKNTGGADDLSEM